MLHVAYRRINPSFTGLQSWTRDDCNGGIEPDWLRIGTDITGRGPILGAGLPGLILASGGLLGWWPDYLVIPASFSGYQSMAQLGPREYRRA
jgi:hypothetical protein